MVFSYVHCPDRQRDAAFHHRPIQASAVDLLDMISGREPLENYLRGGRAVLPGAPPRQAQCVSAGSSIEEEHASACWQGDRVVSFRRF
jgi:hypothetical protein